MRKESGLAAILPYSLSTGHCNQAGDGGRPLRWRYAMTEKPSLAYGRTVSCHAAQRWANAVFGVIDSETDPTTIAAWGHGVGAGRGTLRVWCRAAKVSAKASLDFARVLRAVVVARECGWDPQNLLDIVDERTLRKLLTRSGFEGSPNGRWRPTPESFLQHQRLISDPDNLKAITVLLKDQRHVSADWSCEWTETTGVNGRALVVVADGAPGSPW